MNKETINLCNHSGALKQAIDTTRKLAQIKEPASALGWGQKKGKLEKKISSEWSKN